MSTAKWAYSLDGERYHGEFDSWREAALEGLGGSARDSVWVGEMRPPIQPDEFEWADHLLEHVSVQDDYSGEWAEDWPAASKAQLAELDEEINLVLGAWLDRHGLRPTHFLVEEVCRVARDDVIEGEASAS